jgi:hypothetical protein
LVVEDGDTIPHQAHEDELEEESAVDQLADVSRGSAVSADGEVVSVERFIEIFGEPGPPAILPFVERETPSIIRVRPDDD